jgi:membrane-associated phospholipid phosphatase
MKGNRRENERVNENITTPGHRPLKTVAVLGVHALVLASLMMVEGPFARFYRGFQAWATDDEDDIVYQVKGGDQVLVNVNLQKNGVTGKARQIPLGRDWRLHIYRVSEAPQSWQKAVASKLLRTDFWRTFTQIGTAYMAIAICLFIWVQDPSRRRQVAACLIGIVAGVIMVWFFQHMVGKLRMRESLWIPQYMAFPTGWGRSSGFSFPSGHTTTAFVVATFLASLYPPARALFFGFAGGCGLSRVILQQHWLSDVYAGALLGYGVMLAVFFFLRRREAPQAGSVQS